MVDTQVVTPATAVASGPVSVAGRSLRLLTAVGHTDGDLMIFDEKTRTLFSGDLVFFERAPTTPTADVPRWLAALDDIDKLDFRVLVPGHGPVVRDHTAIAQTRDYLLWLSTTLHDAVNRGLDMPEVMRLPIPPRFQRLAVIEGEYTRSVTHLYPAMELGSLAPVKPHDP